MSSDLEQKMREQGLKRCPHCNGSGFVRDEYLFGAQMQARREAAGVTLRELAGVLGLSIGYISDLEHGRKKWRGGLIVAYMGGLSALRRNLESDFAVATHSYGGINAPGLLRGFDEL